MSDQLSFDAVVATARATAGLDDFGESSWEEGLRRLLDAMHDEARLSEIGVGVATAMLVDQLVNRLRIIDVHARHPEIGETPVNAPVVILGQPRTGTTILFDLLAQDTRFRTPLTWEVGNPFPPPETATFDTDPRIAEAEARSQMTELLVPGFSAIHPSGALRAQECVAITTGDFRSMAFSTAFRIPRYAHWLAHEADMSSAYRYHRQFLQLLQWKHPADRWLLKSPAHQWSLPALFAEYPDATIIHTHRDPLKVIASVASLTSTLQRLASNETSLSDNAAEWAEYIVDGLDRSVAGREHGIVPAEQAIDLPFRSMMQDPFGSIAAVYSRLGLDFTDETEAAMRRFLDDNPADKHGVHSYTFSATGLDVEALRARTRGYEEYFDVPQERLD